MSVDVTESRPIEEIALFNPAFLALLAHQAADQHAARSGGSALPTPLVYVAVPLVLHGPTRRSLPGNVTTQMGEWIRAHPEAALGLGRRARALRPLISPGLRLGLTHGLLAAENGALRARVLPRRRRGMARSAEVDACLNKAGFVGRWFSEQPDLTTTMALWGLRA